MILMIIFLLFWGNALWGSMSESTLPFDLSLQRDFPLVPEIESNRVGSLRGVLLPIEDVRLCSKEPGILEGYTVEEGQVVHKGDIVARLNAEEETAEVEKATALIKGTEAEIEHARAEFERIEGLFREGISSKKQYEETKFQLSSAQSKYDQAKASLSAAKSKLESRVIRSPIDGIFFKKLKNPGESIERFEAIGRVVNTKELQMVVFCDAKYFGKVKVADQLQVEIIDGPSSGRQTLATVVHVDSILDPISGTFRVKLLIQPTDFIVAGMSALLLLPEEGTAKRNELSKSP
ncbi:efflux RND transporter periplasmic adaptor subunit [Candidatus Methylacidiphilum infernorum]|nr:efflux RND transporter periplasmic adaptor subunit [Candidatus Methylacidiphilum infernorum]